MRYEPLSRLDTTVAQDGDGAFLGFRSRVQGAALPPGVAQYLQNIRCERGTAKVRGGLKPVSTDITPGDDAPLTLEFDLIDTFEVTMTRAGSTVTVTKASAHGLSTGDWVQISGAVQTDYNGDWEITVTGANTFTYDIGAATPASPATGTITCSPGEIVLDIYGGEVRASCVYATTDNSEGLLMVTGSRAFIYREGVASAEIAYPASEIIETTQACAAIQFLDYVYIFRDGDTAMRWDMNPANDFVLVTTGAHPSGGTYIRMPNAAWGALANRRFILPYDRDELILSAFGDADTYDTQYGELRILPGSRDWLVGADNFETLRVLVLYRFSLHLVELDADSLDPVQVNVVTRQFGCAARRSVQLCDDRILILSDNGVKVLELTGELNLKPADLTLSDPVQDIIDRINWDEADRISSIFWQNRYYLALPLDGEDRCRAVLVYNFLNREWESLDTYPGDMDVQDFHIMGYDGAKRLHISTSYGFLFLAEENEADSWATAGGTPADYAIEGQAITRRYLAQSGYARKVFKGVELQVNETLNDAFTVTLKCVNPDLDQEILEHTAAATDDITLRPRARARGVAAAVQIDTTAGRPEIRAVTLNALVPGNDSRNQT